MIFIVILSNIHSFAVIYYGGNGIKSSEYFNLGRPIDFHYYRELSKAMRHRNQIKWLKNFGQSWGMEPSNKALVMVDSHDLQRFQTGEYGVNINYFEPALLKVV